MTQPQRKPLQGLRVIEIASTIPAAACGRQFARWGAQVVYATAFNEVSAVTESALRAQSLNSNKQHYEGRLTESVMADADVIVTDKPITTLPASIIDGGCPVIVDISPFGRQGPYAKYAGNAFIAEAMSGFMSVQGENSRAPLRMPGTILAKACGISAFNAALAALHNFRGTGTHEQIEVSCMQLLATIVPTLRTQVDQPEARDGGPGIDPLGVRLYQFGDSYLSFNFAMKSALTSLLDIIGLDDSHIPESLATFRDRQDYPKLKSFVEGLPSPFDAHDLFTIMSEPPHSSAVGKVLSPAQTIDDIQLAYLKYWQAQSHPIYPRWQRTGPPARLSCTPAAKPQPSKMFSGWVSRPQLNAHNANQNLTEDKPLTGVRIIDLTQAWIGPFASQTLSDLGAEVIKVESLSKPDVWRNLPPKKPPHMKNPDAQLVNSSCNFNSVNRDKKSLVLDLSSETGKTLFLSLVASADIVMENYRPQVMPKLGLSYDVLKSIKPDLIMTSFSAYGERGPYSAYRGNGTTIESISGWDSLFGYPNDAPLVMGFYQADAITGLQMAATTLVALNHRDQTGEGQHVQGSMFETAVDYIEEFVLLEQLNGDVPRSGNRSPDTAPQGVYRCQGKDDWIAVSVETEQQWLCLCKIIEKLDAQMGPSARFAQANEIDRLISLWTKTQSKIEATRQLQAVGVPAAPVQTTDELLEDPHLKSINWWHQLEHPDLGTHQYAGFPYLFRHSKLQSEQASAQLGQHSRSLLGSELQLKDERIDELFEAGISGAMR